MFDDTILLKIKRDFTESEAVGFLLKENSDLQMEVGMLKSECEELKFKMMQPKGTKKEWLKDEVVAQIDYQMKLAVKKNNESSKKIDDWRQKYFSLLIKYEKITK